jgi:hypothetical protein
MNWSVFKHFHGVGTPPTYDVISTRSLNTVAKGLSSENHALLIAASPDLLAALQMVDRIWSHDQTTNLATDSPAAIVRAAIAKATGVRA